MSGARGVLQERSLDTGRGHAAVPYGDSSTTRLPDDGFDELPWLSGALLSCVACWFALSTLLAAELSHALALFGLVTLLFTDSASATPLIAGFGVNLHSQLGYRGDWRNHDRVDVAH